MSPGESNGLDGQDERHGLTPNDWLRYGFLAFLASLLYLIVFGRNLTGVLSLLALYVVAGTAAAIVLARRRGWL